MYVEAEMPEGASGARRADVTRPRPGHADLAGAIKYGHDDIRDVLERASARETAARVAAGVARPPAARALRRRPSPATCRPSATSCCPASRVVTFAEPQAQPDDAPLRCVDADVQQRMIAAIDAAKDAGDTLGGAFEVIATGLPPGPRLLRAVGSQARRPPGAGARCASTPSRRSASASAPKSPSGRARACTTRSCRPPAKSLRPARPTNNAGGLEGGVTNGEDVRVTGFMKPIATLMKPLRSVDLTTLAEAPAAIERSDVCAVPAAAVVGEAMVAFVLADAFLEKFGGDSVDEIERHYAATAEQVRQRFAAARAAGLGH